MYKLKRAILNRIRCDQLSLYSRSVSAN